MVGYLEGDGWDVYQEVATGWGVADIVAVRGRHCWLIECKLTLGLDVIAQALKQRFMASWVSVAVPTCSSSYMGARWLADQLCQEKGIGVILVDPRDKRGIQVSKPAFSRFGFKEKLVERLSDEQKTSASAGTNKGGYWTPFKATAREVAKFVASHPGSTAKAVIDSIQHHWSGGPSAKATMLNAIERGWVPGVEIRREGRAITLWPVATVATIATTEKEPETSLRETDQH